MKVIYVDIDGTICTQTSAADYEKAEPIKENVDKINKLYDEGNTIIYWTARGTLTQIDWMDLLEEQLDNWGCRYHDIRVGKPYYDLWIDDKAKRIEEI